MKAAKKKSWKNQNMSIEKAIVFNKMIIIYKFSISEILLE